MQGEDWDEVRKKFMDLGMVGMVDLIDHLAEEERAGRHIERVGSSSIDLNNLMECKNMSEKEVFETVFFRLSKLHFGGKGRTPMQDITNSFDILASAPEYARKRIDEIVGEFAKIGRMVGRRVRWVGNEPVPFDDLEEVDTTTVDDYIETPQELSIKRSKLN